MGRRQMLKTANLVKTIWAPATTDEGLGHGPFRGVVIVRHGLPKPDVPPRNDLPSENPYGGIATMIHEPPEVTTGDLPGTVTVSGFKMEVLLDLQGITRGPVRQFTFHPKKHFSSGDRANRHQAALACRRQDSDTFGLASVEAPDQVGVDFV